MANQKLNKRPGYMIPFVLIVLLLGITITGAIFALGRMAYVTDRGGRIDYKEEIDVASVIEEAKGFVIAENYARGNENGTALHGRKGEITSAQDYFAIESIEDLQVNASDRIAEVLSRDIRDIVVSNLWNGQETTTLKLRVYDANYKPEDVAFTPGTDFPPPIRPLNRIISGSFNENYIDVSKSLRNPNDSSSGITVNDSVETGTASVNIYRVFGAYLIRVDVFRGGTSISRTEECFSMFISKK